MRNTGGVFIGHTACISCKSSDALGLYKNTDDSITGFCYSCKKRFSKEQLNGVKVSYSVKTPFPKKKYIDWIGDLKSGELGRGIGKGIASKYGVKIEYSEDVREPLAHYYPLTKEGQLVGYKERTLPKKFSTWGEVRNAELFGQNLFRKGGKLLCICEGELDTLSASQILTNRGKNYSVVGVTTGANLSGIKSNLEYINSFENVVLFFDQDNVGKKAARDIAELLPPGKAKIASFSEKDINDLLTSGKQQEFWQSLSSAREYRPDGIIRLSQAWDELWKDQNVESIPYPWEGLNTKLYGMRPRELVTITSGSGSGKTAIIRELAWSLFNDTEDNIGILALEENIGRTSWGLVSMAAQKPLHIREERSGVSESAIKEAWERSVGTGRFIAYDHFGSTTTDNLLNQVRYLINGMDCKWIILDHLSIVVSSMEGTGDERRTIDDIMTRLRTLIEETGAGLILVSHLRRASGDKGHERGAEITLSQLRGSHSIVQLSDAVIGLERDQQADDEREQNLTKIVVLKNRYAGYTGMATHVWYNRKTGRLYEVDDLEGWYIEETEPVALKY